MLPNEAVLRCPRLGLEKAEKTYTHTIHMQTATVDTQTLFRATNYTFYLNWLNYSPCRTGHAE